MAKRRSKKSRDPSASRDAGGQAFSAGAGRRDADRTSDRPSGRAAAPASGSGSRSGGAAVPAGAPQRALGFVMGILGLFVLVPLFTAFLPEARPLTSSGQDLPEQVVVQLAFSVWAAAAVVGLWRRAQWGWWLATVLAVYQMLTNLLGAVLSDVVTGDATGARELVLVGAGARLVLWLAVGLVLHSHRMTLHFDLPWAREEERRRSSRVFTYAVTVLAALYVLSRYVFGPGQ